MRIDHRGPKILALLLFTAVCLATFVYLFTAAGGHLRVNQPYTIKAIVPNAFQLVENGDVRQGGVKVGTVSDVTNRGARGLVEMEIKDEYAPVYRDGAVRVRTKTLVGENYIDLSTGNPRAGKVPDRGTLPLERAEEAVQLDEILSALDAPTRREVRRNLDGLGGGLDGRSADLNRLFAAMKPTAVDGGQVMRVLGMKREQVASVVDDTGRVMQAFADRTEQVRTLARSARVTATAVADRDRELGAAIDALPSALTQARRTSARLGGFSTRARPVVSDLTASMSQLRPLAVKLEPTARTTRTLFRELEPSLRVANPLLDQLRPFSGDLRPAVRSLDALLRQAGPAVSYFRPYSAEFGNFFGNVGSAMGARDALGNKARVHAILAPSSLTAFTPEAQSAVQNLLDAGGLTRGFGEKANAYPKPGTLEDPRPFSGRYPRLVPLK